MVTLDGHCDDRCTVTAGNKGACTTDQLAEICGPYAEAVERELGDGKKGYLCTCAQSVLGELLKDGNVWTCRGLYDTNCG